MSGQTQEQAFKFDVFISYRHADLDGAVAGYLQKSLEHYKIPGEIQKKCGKRNIQRVFRDEEELGAASDLFSEIEQNLKQSEFLVVICSPRILESKWCLREIETFIKYRDREHVLAVLVEGEPDTAFPPILLEEGEPLAVDVRGRSRREVLRHARERMPRLAAPVIGCSYDELFQRRRVYMMRRALALAGLVTAVSLSFGTVTLMQSREIQRQNEEIQKNYEGKLENQSRYLAQLSGELLGQGNRDAALLVALEALPGGSGDSSRPYVAEARIALEEALYTYGMAYRYQLYPTKLLEHKGTVGSCTDFNEQENVLLTSDTRIYIWDADTCELIFCWEDSAVEYTDARLVGDHCVAVLTKTGILCFDYRTGQTVWEWTLPACDAGSFCLVYRLCWAYDAANGRILCTGSPLSSHYSEDGTEVLLTDAHRFYLIDAATGESRMLDPSGLLGPLTDELFHIGYGVLTVRQIAFSPDGGRLAVVTEFSNEDGRSVDLLYHFSVGDGECSLVQIYTPTEDITMFDPPVSEIAWLDSDTLACVRTLKRTPSLGVSSTAVGWALDCWDIPSGQLRFTHEDTCLAVDRNIQVQKVPVNEARGEETIPLVSVVYGNVELCLDWYTGEPCSRIEDRSAIMLNHIWDSDTQVLVTADGYLFVTSPVKDQVWAERFTAYHYYLDLDTIQMAQWHNDRAFLFTSTGVYCYEPPADDDCVMLEETPDDAAFTQDGKYLMIRSYDDRLFLYDAETFDLLWQDDLCSSYSGTTAVLADDRFAAYLDPDTLQVKVRALDGKELPAVALDDAPPSLLENDLYWCLRPAGGACVFVWNIGLTSVGDETDIPLTNTAVWLVDLEQGVVAGRWSYQDLLQPFPTPLDPERLIISLMEPAATGSGRCVVFPYSVSGYGAGEGWRLERDKVEQSYIAVWDTEEDAFIPLPENVLDGFAAKLSYKSYFAQEGWLSAQGDLMVLYHEADKRIQVVDVIRGSVLHELTVDGIGSKEISFTPDGDHLIFQNDLLCLCVYDWKNGVYTQQNVVPSFGSMKFSFWQDGQVLSAAIDPGEMTSLTTELYQDIGDGIYRLDTSISQCGSCDGRTVVISNSYRPRLYHARTLDDLIAMARGILDGRELTPAERASYLTD